MKTLLTGASGFLGSVIRKALSKHNVITLGRRGTDIQSDISIEIPDIPACDLVIHAAGKAHYFAKSQREKDQFFQVNVKGTANLLKSLGKSGSPKSFVFISTIAVYGLDTGSMIDEEAPLLARDPYGKSKIDAELMITEWCEQNNVTLAILRLPLIVGSNPPGNLYSMIRGINKGYYFDIGGGSSKKSMVLASDVSQILIRAAEVGGIFNLTDGYHPSFSEIAGQIAKQLGKRTPGSIPYWMGKILSLVGDVVGMRFPLNSNKLKKITSELTFDDSKARDLLGWNPQFVLKGFEL